MSLTLRCMKGALAGELIEIDDELVFGRELSDPGRLGGDALLSRRHARIFIDDAKRAVIEDLGSTNGTWVNGQRLTESRILASRDELRVGHTTFTVEIADQLGATQVEGVRRTVPEAAPTPPCVRIVAGPSEGQEIPLRDELLIGRSYGEPGALGGDRRLSRRHARIARGSGGVFFLADTGSTNGTRLNGEQLRGARALKDGDQILVGSSTLVAIGVPGSPLAPELPQAPAVPAAAPALSAPALSGAFQPQGAAAARLSSRRLVVAFGVMLAASAIAAAVAVVIDAPLGSRVCAAGFICHKPPTAQPLRALTTFSGSLGWRIEYDPRLATPSSAQVTGNVLALHETSSEDRNLGIGPGSDAVTVWVRAFPAARVSSQAALRGTAALASSALVGAASAPGSDQLFDRPVLGFHLAIGEVLEGNTRTPQGPGELLKVAILAASSGGVTVAATVVYPVQRSRNQAFNPDYQFDTFGDQVLETVRFPSDGST